MYVIMYLNTDTSGVYDEKGMISEARQWVFEQTNARDGRFPEGADLSVELGIRVMDFDAGREFHLPLEVWVGEWRLNSRLYQEEASLQEDANRARELILTFLQEHGPNAFRVPERLTELETACDTWVQLKAKADDFSARAKTQLRSF